MIPENWFFESGMKVSIPFFSKVYYQLSDGLDFIRYRRNLKMEAPDEVIFNDIWKIRDKLFVAVQKSDHIRFEYILFNLLSESDKLKGIPFIAASKCIEGISVCFSSTPCLVEKTLFIIQLSFNGFFRDWDAIYNLSSSEPYMDEAIIEKSLKDSNYWGLFNCFLLFYRVCLKISEVSVENLIRVGNYLYDISEADSPLIRKLEAFDVGYLSLLVLVAAKAKAQDIEPMGTKLTNVLKAADKHRVMEAFKVATEEYANKFTVSGNNKVILATPCEIRSYLEQFERQR